MINQERTVLACEG